MTAPFVPQQPGLQRPKALAGYNPVGTSQSTFKPLVQDGADDEAKKRQQQAAPQPAQAQPAPQPQRTFAQMQAAGEARPAPPPALPSMSAVPSGAQSMMAPPPGVVNAPGSQGSTVYTAPVQNAPAPGTPPGTPGAGQPSAVSGALQQSILQALQNPSAYGSDQVWSAYGRMGEDIDDEFTRRNAQLKEEMARRGLSDSTINTGRGYELNVEKRSAKSDLANQLLDKMAQTFGADRAAAISAGLASQDAGLREKLGLGELGLNQQRLGFDQNNATLDRALREKLGLGELDINQQRTNNDLTLGQNNLLGSVLNSLLNSNVDLSSLPPGFLNTVLGRATGPVGGSSGGGSGAPSTLPGGRPFPGGSGGAGGGQGTPQVDTSAGGGLTSGGQAPYTPQWQQDPASGMWVDPARPGERWSDDAVQQWARQHGQQAPLGSGMTQLPGVGQLPAWMASQVTGRTYQVQNPNGQWATLRPDQIQWTMGAGGVPEPDWGAMGWDPATNWRSYSGGQSPWGG